MKHDYSFFGWVLWAIGLGIAIFAMIYACWGMAIPMEMMMGG
jgi:hypothetical protein